MFKKYSMRFYNYRLLAFVVIASVFGLVIINSADSSFTVKQALGLIGSLAWMIIVSFIDYNRILKHYRLWYILAIILLVTVLVVGATVGGAKRWIPLGSIRLQPSEIAKILLVLFLSQVLVMNKSKINTWRFLIFMALVLLLPLVLLVVEPDLSQTILLFLILFVVFFCADLPYKKLGKVLAVVVPLAVVLLIYIQNPQQKLLKPYQWLRVMAFFDPENYDDSVYQQNNAVQAIGSGGLTGKGLNTDDPTSLLNADFIPEAHTDFIFAALGEQLGFVGCIVALGLLAAIVFECILVARRTRNKAGRLVAQICAAAGAYDCLCAA